MVVPSGARKVMGWLGAGRMFLPESLPSMVQKGLELLKGETDWSCSLHLERAASSVRWNIWLLRVEMLGSAGLFCLSWSRCWVRVMTSGLRVGSNDFRWPDGLDFLAALVRTRLKVATALEAEVGAGVLANSASVSWVNSCQSAFLKLVKVLR